MMRRVAILLFLLLPGCLAYQTWMSRKLTGTPDAVAQTGPYIYLMADAGEIDPAALAAAVDRLWPMAWSACPASRRDDLQDHWKLTSVLWEPLPFMCGRWVKGCAPNQTVAAVSTFAILGDEMGHIVWEQCYDRTGEEEGWILVDGGFLEYDTSTGLPQPPPGGFLPDGGSVLGARYDEDYAGWVKQADTAAMEMPGAK